MFSNSTNDSIIHNKVSTIKLFADDTSLYLIVDDPQETAQTLNDDLVKLHAWSTKWLVNFNPQKTETLTISQLLITTRCILSDK
jgi:hypothetical protein